MKAVMISIKPKWVEKIVSGKKTIEVRKSSPKLETPFKCYIYCTKDGGWLVSANGKVNKPNTAQIDLKVDSVVTELNGKVIGEFVCDKICKLKTRSDDYGHCWHEWNEEWCDEDEMQLSYDDIDKYLGEEYGYAWHITDLVIYDKPRELSKFHKPCADIENCLNRAFRESGRSLDKCFDCGCAMTRPPQSWCYVEELRGE